MPKDFKSNLNGYILFIVYFLLFFSDPLAKWIGIVNYIDEFLGIIFSLFVGSMILLSVRDKEYCNSFIKITVVIISIIIILGFISTIKAKFGITIFSQVLDALSVIKAPISLCFALFYISDNNKKMIIYFFKPIVFIFVMISLVFAIINIFHDIGMSYDIRFGIRSFGFIYNNPGTLNERLFSALAIVAFYNRRAIRTFTLASICIVIVLTFRFNAMAGILILFFSSLIMTRQRSSILTIIPFSVAAIVLAKNQILYYFYESQTPRQRLLTDGINVCKMYMPLGSGFSTFGSDQAAKNYSPLYVNFGYEYIWGMGPTNQLFFHDTFWPMLAAQYGILAPFLYLIMLIFQLNFLFKLKLGRLKKMIIITMFLYLVISSVGASVLSSVEGVTILMFLSLLVDSSSFTNDIRL
ncbi:hypothetical protein [Lactiplantibacillus argentoratensis]|uniref:hypothetical protein n=1 Tax=Lactiplantibacillus argentoratensis TaxID=271881 RepID=UPI003F537E7E